MRGNSNTKDLLFAKSVAERKRTFFLLNLANPIYILASQITG
jgi:hypothetical protein